MPANPMQKKARNAFLLGMLITLLICAIIGGLAYFLISKKIKAKEAEEGPVTYAYVLKKDIKALNQITSADIETVEVTAKAVPEGVFPAKMKSVDAKGKETWTPVGFPEKKFAKVELKKGTILCQALVVDINTPNLQIVEDKDGKVKSIEYLPDIRRMEYSMISLPTEVSEGDFVDIRITFPNGLDLIVVPKKEIKSILGKTIGFDMSEGEIEVMESAVVESYIIKASKLYVAKYVDAGTQETIPKKTYKPTEEVTKLIENNPNVVQAAMMFNEERLEIRQSINNQRIEYIDDAQQNIEEGIKKEIENAQKAREAYLSGLTSY